MSSLGLLATQQARRLLTSWPVLAAIAVTALLAALSTVLGIRLLDARHERYTVLLQQLVREQTRTTPADDAHLEPGLRVIRPPSPGLAIIRGSDGSAPTFWDFAPAGVQPTTEQDLRNFDDAGPIIDMEFVVRVLLALLALILAANATRAVSPGGALVGLRSLPLPHARLWLGQLAGAGIVLVLAWCAVAAAAATVIAVMVQETGQRDTILELLARLSGPALLYLIVMLGLGGILATYFRHGQSQYFAILVSWVSVCLLGPPTVTSLARVWSPVPAFDTMNNSRADVYAEEIRKGEEATGEALAQLRLGDPTPVTAMSDERHRDALEVIWTAHTSLARTRAADVQEIWDRQLRRHERALRTMEWFSPASLFLRIASDMARTGRQDRAAWSDGIVRHARCVEATFFDNPARARLRIPSPRGRRLAVMTRHQEVELRALPQFNTGALVNAPLNTDLALWAAILGYGIALPAVAVIGFVRGPDGLLPTFRRRPRNRTTRGAS